MPRDPLDRYYTPDALAEGCLRFMQDQLHYKIPPTVYEPCSGGGAFGRAALRLNPGTKVRGCDPDPEAAPGYPVDRCTVEDWAPIGAYSADIGAYSAIFTNPHYANVYQTIRTLRGLQWRIGASYLGLLLRATTIEHLMHSDDPPFIVAVSRQRPRWGGPGGAALTSSDTCGSVWAFWLAGSSLSTTMYALPDWRPRGRHG